MERETKTLPAFAIIQIGHTMLGDGETIQEAYWKAKEYFPEVEDADDIPLYRPGSHMDGDVVYTDDSGMIGQYWED